MKSGVYLIVNLVNGKRYIGSSHNFKQRWQQHRAKLRAQSHENRHLQRAWNKNGEKAFEFRILEEIEDSAILILSEQKHINRLNPEYNLCILAGKPPSARGRTVSRETKKKIRAALVGKRHSEQRKKNISEGKLRALQEHPGSIDRLRWSHIGIIPSEDTRRKMSDGVRRRIKRGEDFSHIGNFVRGKFGKLHHNYGKKWSDEVIKKRADGIRRAWGRKRQLCQTENLS